MITEDRLHEIHAELDRQLAERGTALDAIYYCPDAPPAMTRLSSRTRTEARGRDAAAGRTDTRPGSAASWMVGDLISDVLAGLNAGCRSICGSARGRTTVPRTRPRPDATSSPDLTAAAEMILEVRRTHLRPARDRPARPRKRTRLEQHSTVDDSLIEAGDFTAPSRLPGQHLPHDQPELHPPRACRGRGPGCRGAALHPAEVGRDAGRPARPGRA